MDPGETAVRSDGLKSVAAKRRMLACRCEPLFIAAWERALMIHLEVDADALQQNVPYDLDLRDGRAFVSLVAFTMRGMKPRLGSRFAEWLFRPIATHDFLNVRTYVRHGDETGIHFLAEWLSNRLAVLLGPATFGLPYRHGRIEYEHDWEHGVLRGRVADGQDGSVLDYAVQIETRAKTLSHMGQSFDSRSAGLQTSFPFQFAPCEAGSLDEWLMERYTAFNSTGNRRLFFRVWHPPWQQCPVNVELRNISLLTQNWHWFHDARLVGANFSPGFREVWMGRPHGIFNFSD